MCDNYRSFLQSGQVNAAELASLVASATPVVNKLCLITATSDFGDATLEDLQRLRDWVDHAYVSLVELAQLAADRVDAVLNEDRAPSRPQPPLNHTRKGGGREGG